MEWFLIALTAPLLWAISNFIDKLLIEKYIKGGSVGTLLIFSGLIGLFIAPIILIFKYNEVLLLTYQAIILLLFSGIIYIISLLPYLQSLESEDTSLVVPLFQLIPIFSLILGMIFLNEFLTTKQLLGGFVVIVGSIIISLNLNAKRFSLNKKLLFLMVIASFGIAVYSLLFKMGSFSFNYWAASFWFYIGLGIGGLLPLFYEPYRKQFIKLLRSNVYSIIGLNTVNEGINIVGIILINLAFLLAPLAIVWVVAGLQPLFSLLIGIVLTLLYPKLIKEKLSFKNIVHKIIAILIIFFGIAIMNL